MFSWGWKKLINNGQLQWIWWHTVRKESNSLYLDILKSLRIFCGIFLWRFSIKLLRLTPSLIVKIWGKNAIVKIFLYSR